MRTATDCTRPAERPRRTFFHRSGLSSIAHDAVEHAARLLRVDQILVDGARLLDALGDDLFRDLVESHALGLFIVQIQKRF